MNPTTRAILDYNAGRDPVRLRLKYLALRKDPFAFFRGTAPLYFATLNLPQALQQSPRVVGCGDLHLENFASYKGDNRLVYFDLSDFDEVCIAPLSFDIVRFLSSVHVAAKYLKIGNKSAVSLVTDIVDTYATALASTKPRWVERATATGPVKSLLQSVKNHHRRDLIARRTELKNGKTRLIIDGKKTFRASARERAAAKSILAAYGSVQAHPAHFEAIDIASRIAGVGSLGLERYVALVRGDGKSDGRYLVDIKLAKASALATTLQIKQPAWKSEAERVVSLQRISQAISPDLLGDIGMSTRSYVVKELQPTADRVNLAALNGDKRSLAEAMRAMASVIAWAHLRGASRFGADSVEKLAAHAENTAWKEVIRNVAQESAADVFQQWQAFASDYDESGNAFADAL